MTRDDWYGLAGTGFCVVLAWLDDWWRPFWVLSAVVLGVWTIVSLIQARR